MTNAYNSMQEIIPKHPADEDMPTGNIGDLLFVARVQRGMKNEIIDMDAMGQLYVHSSGTWYEFPGFERTLYPVMIERLRGMWAAQARWGVYFQAGMV